jgi:hypothetical protein
MSKNRRNAPCPCGSGKKYKFCHGANKSTSPADNIASIRFDDANKRAIIVTKDILVNQISRDGPIIAKSFDRLAKGHIRAISAVIADSMTLIFQHMATDTEDYKPTCSRLLSSALSAFMASIEVARHGFRRPYGAMARNVVEALATVLSIVIEPRALVEFHAGKLQSTRSISIAKRAIPTFGQHYGLLSEHFVHINRAHAGLEPIVRYEEGEEPFSFIISTLRANAWLIYVVAELVFHDEILSPRYWRYLGQGAFAYNPSEAERAWQQEFLTQQ